MKENKKSFLEEVLKAEQMSETALKNAEKHAQKIVADAENIARNMREETMKKLATEKEKQTRNFEEKKKKLEQDTFEEANAEANKILLDSKSKIQSVAKRLAKEVLEEC